VKNRVVKALLTFAVCGTLTGVVNPSVVQARECPNGHEMELIYTEERGYSYDNPYNHTYYWTEVCWCSICQESHDYACEAVEDHDMCWNEDMTALVCVCGFEDKW